MSQDWCHDIYAVPVGKDYLVHSPLKGVTAMINKAALCRLIKLLRGLESEYSADYPTGLLYTELSTPAVPVKKRSGPVDPFFLGLIPTRKCNMSCRYCDFGSKKASTFQMPLSLAVTAIDQTAQYIKKSGRQVWEIHFFGGEPFSAPEVVITSVHRARLISETMGLVPHFEVSTNGVFDENLARFVGDYFDAVILSFDGFEDIHDYQRPINQFTGSFKTVLKTASLLSKSCTELCLRCCISGHNVLRMEEIAQWFCEQFKPAVINFETVRETHESRAYGILAPDPFDFAVNYLKARRIIENYGFDAVYSAAEADKPRDTFCPVGKDSLIVSPEGVVSSCYLPQETWMAKGMDMKVGEISKGRILTIDPAAIERLRDLVAIKHERCDRCFCRWSCAGGCHVKQSYPCTPVRYNSFCIQTRIINACTLLDRLNLRDVADRLQDNKSQMEILALHDSDRLEDFPAIS